MYSTGIVVFREILEIAIIVGIICAATRGVPSRNRWVWFGMLGGVAGSLVVAYFIDAISSAMDGMGQDAFNGFILSAAAVMIGWTVVWMKRHGREIALKMRKVGEAVTTGEMSLYSVAIVIALATWREGAEIALFTYSIWSSGQETVANIVAGGMVGALAGLVVGGLIYFGLVKISQKYVFTVTAWMLLLLASGMAAQASGYFEAAGWIPSLMAPVWDTSWLLEDEAMLGKLLHAMIGYTAQPSGMQVVWYGTTLTVLVLCLRAAGRHGHKGALKTMPA
jgi:high-affinity iron transporter